MKKKWVFWIKVVVLLGVAAGMAWQIVKAVRALQGVNVHVDWKWGGIAVAGFCANMVTSALVWRWLAGGMTGKGGDGLPTVKLVGAYTFSQMGKYVPGKVALLLMRIDRAGRLGMSGAVCTLSTILENALYIVSGGLISLTAVFQILGELRAEGKINAWQQSLQWPLLIVAIVALCVVCYPKVFYGLVNRILRKMKRPEVSAEQRLSMWRLVGAVAGFVPCWIFGGIALWASTRCLQGVELMECAWFVGAFSLSVILGMVSLLPGGLLVREAVLTAAVAIQLAPAIGHARAAAIGLMVAGLQRAFQLVAEVVMGVGGMVVARE